MERTIVTVRHQLAGNAAEVDFELPAEIPAAELAELLVAELAPIDQPTGGTLITAFVIRITQPGEPPFDLRPNQTLADVDAWDGAILELAADRGAPKRPVSGSVTGWDPLGATPSGEAPPLTPAEPPRAQPAGQGYVKKRLA